uniref:CBS domain-containing protein n=1 Tax=Myxococcus sp. AB025B TaxID=2562794 RepID=UPI0011447D6B
VWGLATFNPFLMVIAFFIFMGADGEAKQVRMKATLEKVRVAELMTPRWMGVDVGASLEEALWEFRVERRTALPVTEDGRPLGRVAVEAVRAVPAGERTRRQVREVMRATPVARLEEDGWQALRRMAEEESPLLLVVDADGRLAGTLELGDVERGLTLFQNREERAERDARRWREERPA